MPEFSAFTGDDTRNLSAGPGDPHQTFRHWFRYALNKGSAEAERYLAIYRGKPYFAADVRWAERYRAALELDITAGEEEPVGGRK